MLQKSQVHDCTIHQNTVVLMFLKNAPTCHWGGEKNILPEKLHNSWVICCRKHTVSAPPKSQRKWGKNTSYESMSTTANQVTGGGKTQDENKKPFKNIFPEKGRPVWNTVQKRLEHSSIFLSSKIRPQSDKQYGNTAALKNGGFQMSHSKNKSKNLVAEAT